LKTICDSNEVRVAFDCIGGDETGKLFRALVREGVVINFGCLSGKEIGGIPSEELLFRKK